MLGDGENRRDFIVFVGEIHVDAIFSDVDDAGLQRSVDAAERHMDGLRAINGKHQVFGRSRLNADLEALHVLNFVDRSFAVHAAQAEREHADHTGTLHGIGDHRSDSSGHLWIGERFDQVIFRSEQVMKRHDAGLRGERRGIC